MRHSLLDLDRPTVPNKNFSVLTKATSERPVQHRRYISIPRLPGKYWHRSFIARLFPESLMPITPPVLDIDRGLTGTCTCTMHIVLVGCVGLKRLTAERNNVGLRRCSEADSPILFWYCTAICCVFNFAHGNNSDLIIINSNLINPS